MITNGVASEYDYKMERPLPQYGENIVQTIKIPDDVVEQIRAETIAEISREMRMLYGNEYEKQIRADAIEEYKTDILNKIDFEDKWLFDSKSNNADTNMAFSALRNFCINRAEQLKEQK